MTMVTSNHYFWIATGLLAIFAISWQTWCTTNLCTLLSLCICLYTRWEHFRGIHSLLCNQ